MKLKQVFVVLAVLFLFVPALSFAGGSTEGETTQSDSGFKAALVTSTGGLGDRSFNDAAWEGFQRAQDELGVTVKILEPESVVEYETSLATMAELGFDIVAGIGFDMKDPVASVSGRFPNTRFATVNVMVDSPNVSTAQFKDHEGSFLAGAAAAMVSETGVLGFVGGVDAPPIRRFEQGYIAGAEYINPDIEVISTFVGSFADPGKGKDSALAMYAQNADVIFQAAGKTGEGVIDAAKELDKLAIGVDQDQDYIAPGNVLTSMVKRVDVAMYEFIKGMSEGTLESGVHIYGLKENGVGLSEMEYTADLLTDEQKAELDEIEAKIISGGIAVPDAFDN